MCDGEEHGMCQFTLFGVERVVEVCRVSRQVAPERVRPLAQSAVKIRQQIATCTQEITTSTAIIKHNQGTCTCDVPEIKPVFLAVADEGAELARVDVIVQRQQVALVELEGAGELLQQLPHAVDELPEHR